MGRSVCCGRKGWEGVCVVVGRDGEECVLWYELLRPSTSRPNASPAYVRTTGTKLSLSLNIKVNFSKLS